MVGNGEEGEISLPAWDPGGIFSPLKNKETNKGTEASWHSHGGSLCLPPSFLPSSLYLFLPCFGSCLLHHLWSVHFKRCIH